MSTDKDEIKRKIDLLGKKLQGLTDFIHDHFITDDDTSVYETFCVLCEEYSYALDDARTAVRNIDNNDRVSVGPFVRTVAQASTSYHVGKLPANVLAEPGVVKTIDDKLIGRLVERGILKQKDVRAAQYTKVGRRAVTGPKEFAIPGEFTLVHMSDRFKSNK
jgi:hypothetical protein